MSTPQPGPPRRRRIAGERRTLRTGPVDTQEAPTTPGVPESAPGVPQAPASTEPPASKPRRERKPRAARPPRAARAPRTPRRGGKGWWGSLPSLVVLAAALGVLVAVVLLGAFGRLGNDSISAVQNEKAISTAQDDAPAAAERAAATILAYDYRHLSADQSAALPYLTSSFRKEYERTMAKAVRSTALSQKARVTAQVQASAVMRATPDTARVLVFVDQTTYSTGHPGPRTSLDRVEMDMVRQGASWKVDGITAY